MIAVESYQVYVKTQISSENQPAFLSPAQQDDMPNNWDFPWVDLLKITSPNEGVSKLVYQEKVFGLTRLSIYPDIDLPKYIFIEQLEAAPVSRGDTSTERLIEPIGKWLIWHAAQTAFKNCSQNSRGSDEPLIVLESLSDAFDYYQNKVGMKYLGLGSGVPDEDLYLFGFSWNAAKEFCKKQEEYYGRAKRI